MQTRQLHSLLLEFSALCHRTQTAGSNSVFEPVLELLSKNDGLTVARLCKNIEGAIEPDRVDSSTPNPETRAIVEECSALLQFLKVAECKKAVVDGLDKFVSLLESQSHLSLSRFVELAAQAKVRRVPKQGVSSSLRAKIVSHYTDALRSSAEQFDHESFDEALTRLSRDKSARKQEILAIAENFLGYSPSSKTRKGEIIKMISDRYNVNVRQKTRAG